MKHLPDFTSRVPAGTRRDELNAAMTDLDSTLSVLQMGLRDGRPMNDEVIEALRGAIVRSRAAAAWAASDHSGAANYLPALRDTLDTMEATLTHKPTWDRLATYE